MFNTIIIKMYKPKKTKQITIFVTFHASEVAGTASNFNILVICFQKNIIYAIPKL